MNRISRRYGLMLFAPLSLAALILATGEPVVTNAAAQEPERGEQVMNATCQGCHDLRPIATAAKTMDEWATTIDSMVEMGAVFESDEDRAILTEYLAVNHAPLPEGEGKEIVLITCTMCHDLKRIRLGHRSPEEWEETLVSMLNEGAPLSDQEFVTVFRYLARNFAL